MPATDWYLIMNHLTTTFLITALVIVVHEGSGATARNGFKVDQVAEEAKKIAIAIIDSSKYVAQQPKQQVLNVSATLPTAVKQTNISIAAPNKKKESKPPITPDKTGKQLLYTSIPRAPYGHVQKIPPRSYAKQPLIYYHSPNNIYKFPRVIPLPPHLKNHYALKSRPYMFAASNHKPSIAKSPKFSLPAQIIIGNRTDFVRPPKSFNGTINTTTTEATTTTKVPRTKRIWPKKELDIENSTVHNTTVAKGVETNYNNSEDNDFEISESNNNRIRYVYRNGTVGTKDQPTRGYRLGTRIPKFKYTTPSNNFTASKTNDWVPIAPSHYPKLRKPTPTPINKRSDFITNSEVPPSKQTLYLQSFGLVPVSKSPQMNMVKKKLVYFNRKRQLNPYVSGYSVNPVHSPSQFAYGDLQTEGSHRPPRVITKIKHHHHHHHHRYIKTVEKPVKVPFKVEVPKPYPVPVEKKVPYPVEKIKEVEKPVPYPVTVEKKVPYPIGIKVPYPVPVKVVEKEYVPKPYPIIHHVPVIKHVQVKVPHPVPVTVEKKVPYPVEVKVHVPIDRPVPVPIHVEKKVPYPVKVYVPQPYPVETKVPYPVHIKVKEPVEVIKRVEVKVPVPHPYPVKVSVPVPVEKKVPYPVEVEKKVPVPVEVFVPHRVEVEKKVPVYIPKPYPVEKKVPVPVKVPYVVKVPVKVPVQVPVEVPVYIHNPIHIYGEDYTAGGASASDIITAAPEYKVTVHGNTGFTGFQSRSGESNAITTTASPKN